MSRVKSVNIGMPRPNPHKATRDTGIDKRPQSGPVEVRAPGPRGTGLGSGLVGDFIGDPRHHGGDEQAVYSFTREDLDAWEGRLDRELTDGFFGENLTTEGYDVNEARLGEIWQIGDTVQLKVTSPRLPCSTFRGWVDEKGWLRTFTLAARPGAYLSVVQPGVISAGDELRVIHRPDHNVTVALTYRALTTERHLLPSLLEAGTDLDDETRGAIEKNAAFDAG
ncbi:MOSC domain-containing protein YiiM [Microbacteriaceae bacterium SG_E_30_P1]|uniref:MOSC domain-containing protein YiiM n=1 Tax=Antiquaquibacter oligotrophicus TaxID=2880260 RepID=A0ABT6KTR0_9MICO|nr:MOSC domain-containing protein [Antiquaquibacter oligotrophicus]MDH6182582.1 MOSC domain-containing protein YiiM [Antiquaquibacter oligotrophicus]UDF14451.1 MOSC domain-containing protein [Antiquaquibacter oligotrophicus]